jgi:pSer/pThr/pTyr-binding forkhead associated (FHA) protein
MLHPSRRQLEAVVRNSEGRAIARCLLRRGRYVLGQEHKSEIAIDEPSVSASHARLTVLNDEEFFIEDLGSANGTLVNDRPVARPGRFRHHRAGPARGLHAPLSARRITGRDLPSSAGRISTRATLQFR